MTSQISHDIPNDKQLVLIFDEQLGSKRWLSHYGPMYDLYNNIRSACDSARRDYQLVIAQLESELVTLKAQVQDRVDAAVARAKDEATAHANTRGIVRESLVDVVFVRGEIEQKLGGRSWDQVSSADIFDALGTHELEQLISVVKTMERALRPLALNANQPVTDSNQWAERQAA